MKKLVYIIVFIFVLLSVSCHKNKGMYDKRLELAYGFMSSSSDTALVLLREIDPKTIKKAEDKAYYALIYTQAMCMNNIQMKNDSLIKLAINFYSKGNDSALIAKTYYYAAQVYERMGNRKEAITYYNKAIIKTPHNKYKYKSFIYLSWAFMMSQDKPYVIAQDLYNKSYENAQLAKDTLGMIDVSIQKGWFNLLNKRYDDAINCYYESINLASRKHSITPLFQSYNRLAECFTKKGEHDKALYYAEMARKNILTNTNERYLNATLGLIYINLEQWDKAEYYIEKSADTTSYLEKSIYYEQLMMLYNKKGDFKKANTYGQRYVLYKDSLCTERENTNAVKFQKQYEKTQVEIENTNLKIQKRELQILCMFIIFIAFVIGMITYIINIKNKKIIKDSIMAKNETRVNAINHLQEKIIELQEIRSQLQEKEECLKQSNKHHIELREELSLKEKELQETSRQKQELKQRIFDMNEVVKKIRDFKKQKKADVIEKRCMLDEEELSTLSQMINFCYNDVITRLSEQYPELSKDDLNLCSLLCLEVPNSKIALLLNISEDALKQRKSRLKRNKLGLKENETLESFLSLMKLN